LLPQTAVLLLRIDDILSGKKKKDKDTGGKDKDNGKPTEESGKE